MLRTETITPGALELLSKLMRDENLHQETSLEDIAAMKLNAIVGNGTRLKDFVDIAFLSSWLSLREMINAYEYKYQSRNPVMIMKALAYHNEINFKEPIHYLKEAYPWKLIEARLNQMIKSPAKIFPPLPGHK
jgi:hypothetical protein